MSHDSLTCRIAKAFARQCLHGPKGQLTQQKVEERRGEKKSKNIKQLALLVCLTVIFNIYVFL